jgi:hypothetical protein
MSKEASMPNEARPRVRAWGFVIHLVIGTWELVISAENVPSCPGFDGWQRNAFDGASVAARLPSG